MGFVSCTMMAMNTPASALAKLAGVIPVLNGLLQENVSRGRDNGQVLTRTNFAPDLVHAYFTRVAGLVDELRGLLPDLYGDLPPITAEPDTQMSPPGPGVPAPWHFSRTQVLGLVGRINEIFEIRANSELLQPGAPAVKRCVFITHGRSNDWRAVQAFVERDVGLATIELAQEPNLGRTIVEKLEDGGAQCDCAVIVMTGDDVANEGEVRVRENVMHEIGYFHGLYGRKKVVLLHEDGVSTPTNLAGIAYVPFPRGAIEAGFHVLQRELRAVYPT